MAITFMDYLSPADEGVQDWGTLSATATQFVGYVEQRFGVPVKYIGTGGERWEVITAL
jgi:adenylosuccinate synthase